MDMLPVDHDSAERWRLGTDGITVLATGDQTGGAIFAVEIRMPPGGGPPVMHRAGPLETYHVTSGEFAFYIAEPAGSVRRVVARAGDVVPLRGGTPHTIRNEGEDDATAFVVHSPAAVMEGFSRAAARLAAETVGPPRMEDVLELAQRHGVELLGPDPGRGMSRVAVVTGGTAGIGRAVAVRLAAQGFGSSSSAGTASVARRSSAS
ncbi:MAG: cupin domain-containing protein [Lapillicoccus sp.]